MTEVSRRALLGAGAATVALAAIGLPAPALATSVSIPTRSMFSPLVGTTLRLVRGGVTYKAVLGGVFDLIGTTAGGQDRQFGLSLSCQDARVTDGIYRVSSNKLSPVDLFISSAGPVTSPRSLQAIVNRLA